MKRQRRARVVVAAALGALVAGALLVTSGPSVSAESTRSITGGPLTLTPAATPPRTIPTVGPLFTDGLGSAHTCTAAVVDSPGGDVVVTAAHCVEGTGTGLVFAPGYDDGDAPYGTWVVQSAYVDPDWVATEDPGADYAFLIVSPSSSNRTDESVQSVVGANGLGAAPAAGSPVLVAGYVSGLNDEPVVCATVSYQTSGYPSFDCAGYRGGTSGGPWLVGYNPSTGGGTITGLIGGLYQGGCTPDTSYSSPLGTLSDAVFTRATVGDVPDVLPAAGDDGC